MSNGKDNEDDKSIEMLLKSIRQAIEEDKSWQDGVVQPQKTYISEDIAQENPRASHFKNADNFDNVNNVGDNNVGDTIGSLSTTFTPSYSSSRLSNLKGQYSSLSGEVESNIRKVSSHDEDNAFEKLLINDFNDELKEDLSVENVDLMQSNTQYSEEDGDGDLNLDSVLQDSIEQFIKDKESDLLVVIKEWTKLNLQEVVERVVREEIRSIISRAFKISDKE